MDKDKFSSEHISGFVCSFFRNQDKMFTHGYSGEHKDINKSKCL